MPRTKHPVSEYPTDSSYGWYKFAICPGCSNVVHDGLRGLNSCAHCGEFYHLEIRTELLYKCIPVPGEGKTDDAGRNS